MRVWVETFDGDKSCRQQVATYQGVSTPNRVNGVILTTSKF